MKRTATLRIAPAVTLCLALLISGCASTGNAPGGESPSESQPAAESLLPPGEGKTQYPLTLKTWAGETVLEERPERIAVIGSTSVYDTVAALDVTPVYSYTHPGVEAAWWDPAEREKIETIEYSKVDLSPETILEADPDLIITLNYWFEGDTLAKQLMEIAPVLDYTEQPGNKEDWREGQRLVGEALDLSDASEAVIADTERAIKALADANPEWQGKTATVAIDYGGEWGVEYMSVPGGYSEGFLVDLGFAPNPLAENFSEEPQVSEENINLLDGDLLIMSYSDDELRQKREASELFNGLSAVQENRYVVDADESDLVGATWILRQGASADAITWLLDTFENKWLAGVEFAE